MISLRAVCLQAKLGKLYYPCNHIDEENEVYAFGNHREFSARSLFIGRL